MDPLKTAIGNAINKIQSFASQKFQGAQQAFQSMPQPVQTAVRSAVPAVGFFTQPVQAPQPIQDFTKSLASSFAKSSGGLQIGQGIGKAFTTPIDFSQNQSFVDTVANESARNLALVNTLQRQGKFKEANMLIDKTRNMSKLAQQSTQQLQDTRRQAGIDTGTGLVKAGLTLSGAKALTLPSALVAGGLGAGINAATGGNIAQGAGQAIGQLPETMGLGGITGPLAAKLAPIASKLNSTVGRQLTSRGITGLLNVAEDEVFARLEKQIPQASDRIVSAVLGSVMNPTANKEAYEKSKAAIINKLPKELKASVQSAMDRLKTKASTWIDTKVGVLNPNTGVKEYVPMWRYKAMEMGLDPFDPRIKREQIMASIVEIPSDGLGPDRSRFQAPYTKGDVTTLEKRLDDILGTSNFVYANKNEWKAKSMARNKALSELGKIADQDPAAKAYFDEANALFDELAKARKEKGLPTIEVKPPEVKERGFVTSMKESPTIVPEVKNQVKADYEAITNKETLAKAQTIINTDAEVARNRVFTEPLTAETAAIGQDLIRRYQNNKQYDLAIEMIEKMAEKATSAGQAIQALSMWSRLTPEGALKYAQKLASKANVAITTQQADAITKQAQKLQAMEPGKEQVREAAKLMAAVHEVVPSSLLQKLSTFQTMMMLLNPKTITRNVIGNTLYSGLENITQTLATPLDIGLSTITGKRTITAPNLLRQAKAWKEGLIEGAMEAWDGIETGPQTTIFDLPKRATFERGTALNFLERVMGVSLRATDKAASKAVYEDTLQGLMEANGVKTPEQWMIDAADHESLVRTFQDTNIVSKVFTGLKKTLNGGKEWGVGDLILKFPRTPANLLVRAADYSPVGFINTLLAVSKPLMGKEFDQREFGMSLTRALVGSVGIINTGYILGKMGIITGAPETDKDIRETQKQEGLGGYKINVSALKRFVLSGMNPAAAKAEKGDTLYSYDWAQPVAVPLSIGANIGQEKGVKMGSPVDALLTQWSEGVNTLVEQPLVQGVQRAFSNPKGLMEGLKQSALQAPASFVPQLLSQVNQFMDNTSRDTRSTSDIQTMINLVKAKIPGLAQSLPERYTVWGEPMERYQGNSNTFFNVFLNPAFKSTLKMSPEGEEVLKIFGESGLTEQAPRVVSNSVTINGQKINLTPEQVQKYQKYVGERTRGVYNQLINDIGFKNLSNEEKAKLMGNFLTDINTAAKMELFGQNQDKASDRVKELMKPPVVPAGQDAGVVANGGVKTPFSIITDKNGDAKIITNSEIKAPQFTGSTILDKKIATQFYSDLSKKQNDILALYQNGKLSQAEAAKQINDLEAMRTQVKSRFKTARIKKLKKVSLKKIKMPTKAFKVKIKMPKMKTLGKVKLKYQKI